jgi:hypothetical protein
MNGGLPLQVAEYASLLQCALAGRKINIRDAGIYSSRRCKLKEIEESDLVFFACSASRRTRNQLQIEFSGTSKQKEQA